MYGKILKDLTRLLCTLRGLFGKKMVFHWKGEMLHFVQHDIKNNTILPKEHTSYEQRVLSSCSKSTLRVRAKPEGSHPLFMYFKRFVWKKDGFLLEGRDASLRSA
jgi:hypothetical protein